MTLQRLTVRLKDGSEAHLIYEVDGDRSTLRPDHLSWNGRPPFSLLDVVDRLTVEVITGEP